MNYETMASLMNMLFSLLSHRVGPTRHKFTSKQIHDIHVDATQSLTLGRSVANHVRNCAFRSSNSVYQKPSVVDSHEI